MNLDEAVPCKRCGSKPILVQLNDLWYARCPGHEKTRKGEVVKCQKWLPFEFLGITPKAALDNWNYANSNKTGVKYEEIL